MKNDIKANSFSVFLINTDKYNHFSELVVDGLEVIEIAEGELFFKTDKEPDCPSWVDGFFGKDLLGEDRGKLTTKSLSAIYITRIPVGNEMKSFAVSFGYGRYLLRPEFIQHDFGLDTSRHAIDAARISSMSTLTYDSSIKDKTIRSAEEIGLSDYFLNANTDVLTSVRGKVRSEKTGHLLQDRLIGGKDAVLMTAFVNIKNLPVFLNQLYSQYVSDGQEGVKYESNLKKLKRKEDIIKAEQLLQIAIDKRGHEEKLYLSLPIKELDNKEEVRCYQIGGEEYKELDIDILDKYNTVKLLKETPVIIKFNNEEALNRQLFCFVYAELETETKDCCILTEGEFYLVTKSYRKRVDDYYNKVNFVKIDKLTKWNGSKEGAFNKGQKADSILVMDEQFVFPGNRDRFEVCDLLTKDKHIVHVKIFDVASQPLGHLFNQGMLSAQCLTDDEIRPLIQQKIEELQTNEQKTGFSIDPRFSSRDYTVTFLILCMREDRIDNKGRPIIPFLSKAVFKENGTVIENLGFKLALACVGKA